MSDAQEQYTVVIPEDFAGIVMGELNMLGATLENFINQGHSLTINLTSTKSTMDHFEEWLHEATDGQGNVSKIES